MGIFEFDHVGLVLHFWAGWPAVVVLVCVPPLALAVDGWLGEPPVPMHPVVWMGRALDGCGQRLAPLAPRAQDYRSFWLGAIAWCALAALVLIAAYGLQWLALQLPMPLAVVALALLLKPLMALALLQSEVRAVEAALAESLEAGRARLAWLVSRDVAQLSAEEVRQSAIETLAENLNDSVVAPLFWFVLLGLPGAALYRFANTADAMWGYPGMRGQGDHRRYWQWAGKWAARADDVLSWLPARITALLLALVGGSVPLRALAQEARKTPSPNSGWPMAAMALALGVRLSKPGAYCLHEEGRAPTARDAAQAQKIVSKVAITLILIALVALFFIVLQALRHGE
ncbi:adenosylcobinamide-phosphate synthase CbiB [Simplicispira psychrophila]|uniref:adenosylcobinamide-phosphate synthase CbiB n=1 Tax=Simplicispira psychrophila TaxID=80882 RepID=UPI000691429A|nr:adenosylcobinamide-phosphate synthase CbiB [Simplicispira psychrophila]